MQMRRFVLTDTLGSVLQPSDRLEIQELEALYGHLIDQRRWDDLDRIFAAHVVIESTAETTNDLPSRIKWWRSLEGLHRHPVAHNITNTVIHENADGSAGAISKGVLIKEDGHTFAVVYEDTLSPTESGWRIVHRRITNLSGQSS
jgi:hypothetical protein